MPAIVRLRTDQLATLRHRKQFDSNAQLAAAMGISRVFLYRVINGKRRPGQKFISGLCHVLDADIDELFDVTEEDAA